MHILKIETGSCSEAIQTRHGAYSMESLHSKAHGECSAHQATAGIHVEMVALDFALSSWRAVTGVPFPLSAETPL